MDDSVDLVKPEFLFPCLSDEEDIEAALERRVRELILEGIYPEGTRLPSTQAWAKALKVNDRRVQRALLRLAAQGLLERRPRHGTYVKRRRERPTVVILVGWALIVEHLHHQRKVVELLIEELTALGYGVEVIDDLFSLLINDFGEQQRRLTRFRDRLQQINPAGYVECSFDLSRLPDFYPMFQRPLVSFYPTTSGGDVYFDEKAFIHASLRYLASKGRRKVLLIRSAGRLAPVHDATRTFWGAVEAFGFIRGNFRELYHGAASDAMETEAYHWILQLVESWKELRRNYVPDCLVVNDDIVMRGVAAGLIKAGVKIPDELLIVTQANEGVRFRYGIPVVHCEVPLRALARNLVELLDARIGKRKPPAAPILLTETRVIESPF